MNCGPFITAQISFSSLPSVSVSFRSHPAPGPPNWVPPSRTQSTQRPSCWREAGLEQGQEGSGSTRGPTLRKAFSKSVSVPVKSSTQPKSVLMANGNQSGGPVRPSTLPPVLAPSANFFCKHRLPSESLRALTATMKQPSFLLRGKEFRGSETTVRKNRCLRFADRLGNPEFTYSVPRGISQEAFRNSSLDIHNRENKGCGTLKPKACPLASWKAALEN